MIEYMFINETEASGTVRLQGVEVEKAHEFKCSKEMKKCRKGGHDGEKVSGMTCNKRVAVKMKGRIYRVVRPLMLLGLETVANQTGDRTGGGRVRRTGLETSTSERQHNSEALETKLERPD